jgi:hypothetical protein
MIIILTLHYHDVIEDDNPDSKERATSLVAKDPLEAKAGLRP